MHLAPLIFGGRGLVVRHTRLFSGATHGKWYVLAGNLTKRKYGEDQ